MTRDEAIQKLENLRSTMDMVQAGDETVKNKDVALLYGEVEELLDRLLGIQNVAVQIRGGTTVTYKNFIEAGYLSGRTTHRHAGYMQLQKAIGKLRQQANDSILPMPEPSVSHTVQILQRFRECCQYLGDPPSNERAVQDITWIMLRSQFDRVDREDTLPRLGAKSYRPDFGIPDLGALIEVKFVGDATQPARIQEEILADIPGYLQDTSRYAGIIVLVYDAAQKLRDPRKFVEDLRGIEGILEVIVIPGVG